MSIGELILRCFHARTNAHVLHLTTRSYAAHKALNEFYDEIVDLADALIETYQGAHGPAAFPELAYTPVATGEELTSDLIDAVDTFRTSLKPADSHLANLCDEIKALCDSTGYKLRCLK